MLRLLACAVALFAGSTASAQATFTGIGDLSGGVFESGAAAVSADGLVVVGSGTSASGAEPVVWTQAEGLTSLGLGQFGTFAEGYATGVSADGSVVAGSGPLALITGETAFRSVDGGHLQGLGDLPGGDLIAFTYGVSADGTVVVGRSHSSLGNEAFRWTGSGGMQALGDLADGSFSSTASAASSNGDVIVGDGQSASGQEPFRWTSGGGMVGLGRLSGDTAAIATAVTADGSVIVGASGTVTSNQAFRWTSGGGMVGLGDLPGGASWSIAYGISADGSVVVGDSIGASGGTEPFLWDAVNGMRSLADVLENDHGLDLTGWDLTGAAGVSADGRTIVGTGENPDGFTEGWVAILPAPAAVPALGRAALAAVIALLLLVGALVLGSRAWIPAHR